MCGRVGKGSPQPKLHPTAAAMSSQLPTWAPETQCPRQYSRRQHRPKLQTQHIRGVKALGYVYPPVPGSGTHGQGVLNPCISHMSSRGKQSGLHATKMSLGNDAGGRGRCVGGRLSESVMQSGK